MPRQPDQYVFTFGPDGAVTSVAEVEKNGRLDVERIEPGETYRLIDGFVVKTEVEGREQEWEVYADPDGDGRWIEVGEGDGPFDQSVLALFGATSPPGASGTAAPAAAPTDDAYVFQFGALGEILGVFELNRDGSLEREEIERDESYVLLDGFVVKTEVDDGRVEQTIYADPDGDGVWAPAAQVLPGASPFGGW